MMCLTIMALWDVAPPPDSHSMRTCPGGGVKIEEASTLRRLKIEAQSIDMITVQEYCKKWVWQLP